MKKILNNINLNHLFIALTAIYMGIETQSLFMIWEITNHAPSAELMDKYERFGYAASGLGITLLAARLFLKLKTRPIVVLFMAPIIYIFSVWTVYEAVSRAPEFIPKKNKPEALSSSLAIMTRPKVTSMFSFYTGQYLDKEGLASSFNELHPMPKKAIQSTYLNGITSVNLITQLFNANWKRLDESLYKNAVEKSDFILGIEGHKANKIDSAISELRYWDEFFENAKPLKYVFLSNPEYIRSLMERHSSHELQPKTLVAITYDMLPFGNPPVDEHSMIKRWDTSKYRLSLNEGAVKLANQEYWNTLREKLTFLEGEAPALRGWDVDWDLAIREQFTKHVLSKHVGGADVPVLKWYNKRANYEDNETFLAIINHATPFFFDEKDIPLIDFKDIVEKERSAKMRNSLRMGLNSSLHEHYNTYRVNTLSSLMGSVDKWGNFTNNATFSPLLRIGVILPVLFLISVFLLISNAVSLSKSSYVALFAGLASSATVVLIQNTEASAVITEIMLSISVQKSAITLF
jgi:hypothetical protein